MLNAITCSKYLNASTEELMYHQGREDIPNVVSETLLF